MVMVLKLSTTFKVVESQFPLSWLHPNMGPLSGVIVSVFIELTDSNSCTFSILLLRQSRFKC